MRYEVPLVTDRFLPLMQQPCWQVTVGYGAQLTLNFGMPTLGIREPNPEKATGSPERQQFWSRRHVWLKGAWHLWIQFCTWRVYHGEQLIGSRSNSSARKQRLAATELDGQILTQVRVDPQTWRWRFDFDLGGWLETRPYDRESEQWHLYEPSGMVLTTRTDGTYAYADGTTPPDAVPWTPLPVLRPPPS